jgi:hypothetical protein
MEFFRAMRANLCRPIMGIGARVQVFQSVQGRRVHDVCTGRNNFGADRLEGVAKLSAIHRAAPAGLMRSTTHR